MIVNALAAYLIGISTGIAMGWLIWSYFPARDIEVKP